MNTEADIINFQEVRAELKQIPKKLLKVENFTHHFNEAEKKGYSGVGTFSKIDACGIKKGLGIEELDKEGRVLTLEFEKVAVPRICPFTVQVAALISSYCASTVSLML